MEGGGGKWNICPIVPKRRKLLAAVWRNRSKAAKTALTRGIAKGLGYEGRVTSPTFTIVNEYRADIPVFHFDMYRLEDSDALFDIGWEDYLERGGVCVVEWSENVEDALPADTVTVSIARGNEENTRIITVTGGDFE